MKIIKIVGVFLFAFSICSCEKQSDFSGSEAEQIRQYISSKNLRIDDSTATGFKISFIKRNPSGSLPKAKQNVNLNYSGTLLSGKKFDSGNFSFVLAANQVVKGFELGAERVRVGEKATIIFPSALGYGSSGSGSIPSNSPLVFDIEVLSVSN